MPTPKSRSRKHFRLDVASAKTVPVLEDSPVLPWPVAAVGGGVMAAIAGAVLVCGVVLVGWAGVLSIPVTVVLGLAGRVWLLGHWGALSVAGLRITLVPLGLAGLFVLLALWAGAFAYRQAILGRLELVEQAQRARLVLVTAALVALGYTVTGVVIALTSGAEALRASPGSFALAFVGALLGAGWRAGYRLAGSNWLRAVLRGAAAGVLGLVLASAAVLAVALVQGEARISALEEALGFDGGGMLSWILTSLFYLPTLLGWAASWLLGAGVTVGDGSLIAPWATRLGMLPAVPVFGALPTDGSGGMQAWLFAGLLVGILAGVVGQRGAGLAPASAISAGAAAGLLTSVAYLGWALASSGALGTDRFAEVGPRWPEALVGVAILIGGAVIGAAAAWFVSARSRLDD